MDQTAARCKEVKTNNSIKEVQMIKYTFIESIKQKTINIKLKKMNQARSMFKILTSGAFILNGYISGTTTLTSSVIKTLRGERGGVPEF